MMAVIAAATAYAAGTIGDQASLTITQNYLAHRIPA